MAAVTARPAGRRLRRHGPGSHSPPRARPYSRKGRHAARTPWRPAARRRLLIRLRLKGSSQSIKQAEEWSGQYS